MSSGYCPTLTCLYRAVWGVWRIELVSDVYMVESGFNTYYDRIDRTFWRDLCVGEGELRRYDRGEPFVVQGHVARYIGYVMSGTLKYVAYADDGTECVVGLEFAGGFVADFPFSFYGQRSRVSIVAVTPCELYCVSTAELSRRLRTDEEFRRVVDETNVALFDTTYSRYIDLHTKTARERYDELIDRCKGIFNLFSLKDIASFLNVTPTHLSRLRKP